MRFVLRPAGSCPAQLQPVAVATQLKMIVQTSNKKLVSSDTYRISYRNSQGELCSTTLDALEHFYHAKCAYCETRATLEVEHYRPVGGQRGHHRGYLWLCYEWTNMLPACHDCNTVAGGKGAKFPVLGTRQPVAPRLADGSVDATRCALTNSYLSGEQPMLLHPELDQPARFLTVSPTRKRDGYSLRGIDRDKRGKNTIRICNLNRKALRLDRLAVLQDMMGDMQAAFSLLSQGDIVDSQLPRILLVVFKKWEQAAVDDKQTLTLVRRLAIKSAATFRQIVVPLLPAAQLIIVTQAFTDYKTGTLR